MSLWTVHSKLEEPSLLRARADEVRFVREGFNWPAFLVPPIWLVFKGMWTVLLLTLAVEMAIAALVFLIVIHKLEYFLNSKIIGERIRNPVWLTLIALVIGERLMGIPGLILAPVALNYLRVEMVKIEVPEKSESAGASQERHLPG